MDNRVWPRGGEKRCCAHRRILILIGHPFLGGGNPWFCLGVCCAAQEYYRERSGPLSSRARGFAEVVQRAYGWGMMYVCGLVGWMDGRW